VSTVKPELKNRSEVISARLCTRSGGWRRLNPAGQQVSHLDEEIAQKSHDLFENRWLFSFILAFYFQGDSLVIVGAWNDKTRGAPCLQLLNRRGAIAALAFAFHDVSASFVFVGTGSDGLVDLVRICGTLVWRFMPVQRVASISWERLRGHLKNKHS